MKYILDTHALIWFLEGNPRLGANAKALLSEPTSKLVLPAIALAESIWIVSRSRTSIPSVVRVVIYPLDRAIIEQTVQLSAINEMHDRQIVATALLIQAQGEQVALLTCDQNITATNLVAIVW
jgi:PIN domain nuclease of toxin-antitoxin system